MRKYALILTAACFSAFAQESIKLQGEIISTATTTNSQAANAFDSDFNTYFYASSASFGWVGLELEEPCVITKIGYSSRNTYSGEKKMQLGVFQGANEPDFSDALPIYLIPGTAPVGEMAYVDIDCSRGFKYLRYVGPNNQHGVVAELEFYGYPGEGDDSHLYQPTNLPLVVVNTPNMEWFHENDKEYAMEGSLVSVIDNGNIDVSAKAQIRGRGNASWGFPKKPFRIKFDKKQKVLGGPAKAKKWTMINNYGDKTLMRNMLAFEISRRMGLAFTPACHPVDLIFNGEYQGTYQLCDQVEVNENRVNITEMEPTDTEGEALTGGYLIEIDAYANQEPDGEWFYSQGGHSIPVTIKSPDPGVAEQFNYIRSKFTDLEKAVYGVNYGDPETGYRSLLDEESFLRHFIVGELSGNTDTYWSVYMTLDRGADKFVTGPVWDFDLAFENDNRTYPINNKTDFICFANGSFANGMKTFVSRIIKNSQGSKPELQRIWTEARLLGGLNAEEMDAVIDEYYDQLLQSQDLNFKRWPIMNTKVHQNPRIWGSYDAEVQNVRDYLRARFDKLDSLIGLIELDGISDANAGDAVAYATPGAINVAGAEYEIYNLQGILVAKGKSAASIAAAPGIYIVKQGKKTTKLLVGC